METLLGETKPVVSDKYEYEYEDKSMMMNFFDIRDYRDNDKKSEFKVFQTKIPLKLSSFLTRSWWKKPSLMLVRERSLNGKKKHYKQGFWIFCTIKILKLTIKTRKPSTKQRSANHDFKVFAWYLY